MKNLLKTFAFLFVVTSQPVSAQLVNFGIKGGVNLSQLTGNNLSVGNGAFQFNDNSSRATGFAGGVYVRIGRGVFIQPELMLSQKGGKYTVGGTGGTVSAQKVDVKFSHLDIPVLLGFRVAKVLRINAGPMFSVKLSEDGNLRDSFTQYQATGTNETFESGALGYQAGIGADLGSLSLDVRYCGNFNDVYKVGFASTTTQAQFGRQLNMWQATVGIKLL